MLSTDSRVHNIRPLEPEKPNRFGNTPFLSTPSDSMSGGSDPYHLLTQCQGVILSALCEASGLAGKERPSPSGDGVSKTLAPSKGAFRLASIGSRGSGANMVARQDHTHPDTCLHYAESLPDRAAAISPCSNPSPRPPEPRFLEDGRSESSLRSDALHELATSHSAVNPRNRLNACTAMDGAHGCSTNVQCSSAAYHAPSEEHHKGRSNHLEDLHLPNDREEIPLRTVHIARSASTFPRTF